MASKSGKVKNNFELAILYPCSSSSDNHARFHAQVVKLSSNCNQHSAPAPIFRGSRCKKTAKAHPEQPERNSGASDVSTIVAATFNLQREQQQHLKNGATTCILTEKITFLLVN